MRADELDGFAADMKAFGYSAEAIQAMRDDLAPRASADEPFEVHAVNANAVRLFLALQTQWQAVGLGGLGGAALIRTGLNYAAIKPTAELAGLALDAGDFDRLQLMEATALAAFAESRS